MPCSSAEQFPDSMSILHVVLLLHCLVLCLQALAQSSSAMNLFLFPRHPEYSKARHSPLSESKYHLSK